MHKTKLILIAGLDNIRDYLNPWVVFVISVLTMLAFWPKIKASVIGKLMAENHRLRGLVADLTLEETIKNVIIANNKTVIAELEQRVIDNRREALHEITRTKS